MAYNAKLQYMKKTHNKMRKVGATQWLMEYFAFGSLPLFKIFLLVKINQGQRILLI